MRDQATLEYASRSVDAMLADVPPEIDQTPTHGVLLGIKIVLDWMLERPSPLVENLVRIATDAQNRLDRLARGEITEDAALEEALSGLARDMEGR